MINLGAEIVTDAQKIRKLLQHTGKPKSIQVKSNKYYNQQERILNWVKQPFKQGLSKRMY